jgi:hypothetical protein
MTKPRDILILLGVALGGYYILKKTEQGEEKTIQSIRTQYETEQVKPQAKEDKEAQAWRQYTETQIACETLYDQFRKDCTAYGGSVVDSETLHMISSSYQVLNEKVICDKKYYCIIYTHTIYEEQKRYGAPTIQLRPRYEE